MKNQQESADIYVSHQFFSMVEWVDLLCSPNPDVLFIAKIGQLSNETRKLIYKFIVFSKEMTNEWFRLFAMDLYRLVKLKEDVVFMGLEREERKKNFMWENVPCFVYDATDVKMVRVGYKVNDVQGDDAYLSREMRQEYLTKNIDILHEYPEYRYRNINISKFYDENGDIIYGRRLMEYTEDRYILYWFFLAKAFNIRFDLELAYYENKEMIENISKGSHFNSECIKIDKNEVLSKFKINLIQF